MAKKYLYGLLGLSVLLSGCTVRTYPMVRDRVDQDLSAGNRGYLQGKAPAEAKDRKTKRTTHVVEIEMTSPVKIEKGKREPVAKPSAYATPSHEMQRDESYMMERAAPALVEPSVTFEKYTVQKGDTLQKISQKYFGTTKKWTKIYQANKDALKGPDKIYVGQVLNIPVDGGTMPKKIK
ncbi:MAG: LysM peptidoglycan-binding domain-containing protein [Candidatus Omnitrophota bacterium]